MSRSVGVTAAALVLILAGAFLLVPASYTLLEAVIATTTVDSWKSETTLIVLGFYYLTALLFLAASLWCIATSIGIFRLKGWARHSIVLLSVVGALLSLWQMKGILHHPGWAISGVTPLEAAPVVSFIAYVAGLATSLVPLLVCVWWLILFTRPSVKLQFSASKCL
jgi:hypothetical protein